MTTPPARERERENETRFYLGSLISQADLADASFEPKRPYPPFFDRIRNVRALPGTRATAFPRTRPFFRSEDASDTHRVMPEIERHANP